MGTPPAFGGHLNSSPAEKRGGTRPLSSSAFANRCRKMSIELYK
ncbi:hypothetical protein HMPREF0262_01601 [Clostridium sp. ATCC 29733]|nr:hypothetical protein HMPREF0262_01601 [Clostridium sp. ATCC 29733]